MTTPSARKPLTSIQCGRFVDVVKGEIRDDVLLILDGDRIADVRDSSGGSFQTTG